MRAQWGRIGALKLRATHDPRDYTSAARASFLSSFEQTVDPDGDLPPAERAARAQALRSAHFRRLAIRSVEARNKRKPASAGVNADAGMEVADATGQRPRAA